MRIIIVGAGEIGFQLAKIMTLHFLIKILKNASERGSISTFLYLKETGEARIHSLKPE